MEDLRAIYARELQAKGVADMPQALYNELAAKGYKYIDIVNAYALSVLLDSTALDLLEFKKKETAWAFLAEKFLDFKSHRKIMRDLDGGDEIEMETKDGRFIAAAKADVLVKLQGMDQNLVGRMKQAGLSEEEILGLRVLAQLHGVTDDMLASDIETAARQSGWKAGLGESLGKLHKAAGV